MYILILAILYPEPFMLLWPNHRPRPATILLSKGGAQVNFGWMEISCR